MSDGFQEVACKKCGVAGGWRILTDGQGNYRAIHECGHHSDFTIQPRPDPKAYSLRFFV